jgi:hypothetical protein
MYNSNNVKSGFPDPLAPREEKLSKEYGLRYAKAIEDQWGDVNQKGSVYGRRNQIFQRNRDYANGVQDTTIYKRLLTNLDPNAGDGSLLNIDYTPVPILPKFVRVVVNNVLSKKLYPNLEANDSLSLSAKDEEKNRLMNQVALRDKLMQLKEMTGGMILDKDPEQLPETTEEAEIFLGSNSKTDAEIAAQVATDITLSWNKFDESTFRRCVNDLVILGMAVVKRRNDPNYGIVEEYVDPIKFIYSNTDDPNMDELVYAGHIRNISVSELIRQSGGEISEDQIKKIMKTARPRGNNNNDAYQNRNRPDRYDEYTVEVLDFEFKCLEKLHFEEKENRHGNTGFFYKGHDYKKKEGGVFERIPHHMDTMMVYEGSYVMGTEYIYNYGPKPNVPKNIHDLSRCTLSYSTVATNLSANMPKSLVDSCTGFADMLQLTHLKIQQAIAKAKPDGLVIDIEGLENVQLGKGGELQPLELHDIYEQTGVFYYRSKNPEGGFQNPPVREIGNSIRNINELIGLYNHYLRMIRDTTGINEVVDASSPKADSLVGVQQQAVAASNNATYDITHSALVLYRKVCTDVVKSLQILPPDSVVFKAYENAIGKEKMSVLASFRQLPMYNFGVIVTKDMDDKERAYMEQNIQIALSQKEIDLEDAMAIREMRDVDQAERLLIVRRKARMKRMQEQAMQNSQMQSQQAQQAAQVAAQAKQQEMQMQSQIDAQKIQLEAQAELQIAQAKHEMEKEMATMKAQLAVVTKNSDNQVRRDLEEFKEDRKDERVKKQAVEQSKLISQRKGDRKELTEEQETKSRLDQIRQLMGE